MPAKRELTMRQIRQMLRLARDGVSAREIGRTARRGAQHDPGQSEAGRGGGAGWPLPGELTDDVLEQRLFARAGVKRGPPPARRAGLGGAGLRAEAARRQPDGAVGGVSGRSIRTATATAASAICSASSSAGCRR